MTNREHFGSHKSHNCIIINYLISSRSVFSLDPSVQSFYFTASFRFYRRLAGRHNERG
jgi:hypothetical protein